MFTTATATTDIATAASHVSAEGTLILMPGERLSLFKAKGERHFEVRFSIGAFRYSGSTGCEEADIAMMVARATYASVGEELSDGEFPPTHPYGAMSIPQAA